MSFFARATSRANSTVYQSILSAKFDHFTRQKKLESAIGSLKMPKMNSM